MEVPLSNHPGHDDTSDAPNNVPGPHPECTDKDEQPDSVRFEVVVIGILSSANTSREHLVRERVRLMYRERLHVRSLVPTQKEQP